MYWLSRMHILIMIASYGGYRVVIRGFRCGYNTRDNDNLMSAFGFTYFEEIVSD